MPLLTDLLTDNLARGKFWTDAWSLISGCSPVAPLGLDKSGCKNCWLSSWSRRFEDGLVTDGHFNGTIRMHFERLEKPLRARKPRVYAIWSDLFHPSVDDRFLGKAFHTMSVAFEHHFIICTKRPERAARFLPTGDPIPNVTILGTVENQAMADLRVQHLLRIAAMGWRTGVLCEPLLGPVDLTNISIHEPEDENDPLVTVDALTGLVRGLDDVLPGRLSWVLAGGETGPSARITEVEWLQSLRDQAVAARVPFFLKSRGEWVDELDGMDGCVGLTAPQEADPDDCFQWHEPLPGGTRYYRVGKKHAGCLLDGREWKEVPGHGDE